MSVTPLQFEHQGLKLHVERDGGTTKVSWQGVSDTRDPGAFLNDVLARVVSEIDSGAVHVDFRLLEYMNSATLSPVMTFIKELDARGLETLVSFDETVDWQRVNFRCMKVIVRALKNVRVQSG